MTLWETILDNDFSVPADRQPIDLLPQLCDGLSNPDPDIRDGFVFPILATWIGRGVFDRDAVIVGDRMCELFNHDQTQARTFATLVIACLIQRDNVASIVDEPTAQRWFQCFATWWLAENDTRGFVDGVGWLHAFAHGADTIGVYAASRFATDASRIEFAKVLWLRVLQPTDLVFTAQEDDRLAVACARILANQDVSEDSSSQWVSLVREALTERSAVDSAPWMQNVRSVLKSLYLLADRGFVDEDQVRLIPDGDRIKNEIVSLLKLSWTPVAP